MTELQIYDKNKEDILKQMESEGMRIYRTNTHFKRLANVMENQDFREFYDEYFKDPQMLKVILSFMNTYEQVEKISGVNLTPYQKLSVLKSIFDRGETRRIALSGGLKLLNEDQRSAKKIET